MGTSEHTRLRGTAEMGVLPIAWAWHDGCVVDGRALAVIKSLIVQFGQYLVIVAYYSPDPIKK